LVSASQNRKGIVVFDMDGVLVDVTDSYRAAISATVEHFTGRTVSNDQIQDYKNQGGWNNDWALSQKISADFGVDIPYNVVVEYFQSVFFSQPGRPGFIERERWIVSNEWLESLKSDWATGIFTGRLREEALITLRRFLPGYEFDFLIGDDDVTESKPAPQGLLKIAAAMPGAPITYIGDTVDDASAALGARQQGAPVRFLGIAHPHNPRRAELIEKLRAMGAEHVLEDVNQVKEVL
jgi:HAD superfamily phosphatase